MLLFFPLHLLMRTQTPTVVFGSCWTVRVHGLGVVALERGLGAGAGFTGLILSKSSLGFERNGFSNLPTLPINSK